LADAYYNRGLILQTLQLLDEAVSSYDQAISLNPNYVQAHNNRGIVLHTLKHYDQALLSFKKTIALKPDLAEAYYNMGNNLKQLQRLDEALGYFDQAIALQPDFAAAHNNRGLTQLALRQFQPALESFDRTLALNPQYTEAYNNLGNVLQTVNRYAEAISSFNRAIALLPDAAPAYNNRGKALQDTQQFQAAEADFRYAIALQPDYAGAYWNLALLQLMTGRFEEGWRLFEWRWQDLQKAQTKIFTQPSWLGEQPVSGKVVLIYAEQGFGDFLQFCRYAPMLEALGAHVVIETPPALTTLLGSLPGSFTIVEQGQPLPDFELQCPVMSLPLAFNTTLGTIPASTPYFYADDLKREIWRQKLGPITQPRIGLTWSGSIIQQNDHNRSIPLKTLAPLFTLPLEFHCLQNEIRQQDAAQLQDYPTLHTHFAEINDFADTAALIAEMDLVISVCTATAHLSGAMSKPVWILLPHVACYRWLRHRTDTPWYPSATLLRQAESGNWPGLVAEVVQKLADGYFSGNANV
jgi:tetratricopeptide (TPR) repeat protein